LEEEPVRRTYAYIRSHAAGRLVGLARAKHVRNGPDARRRRREESRTLEGCSGNRRPRTAKCTQCVPERAGSQFLGARGGAGCCRVLQYKAIKYVAILGGVVRQLLRARKEALKPFFYDPAIEGLQHLGVEHEKRYLQELTRPSCAWWDDLVDST